MHITLCAVCIHVRTVCSHFYNRPMFYVFVSSVFIPEMVCECHIELKGYLT